jgi:hypothetical protein
VTLAAAIVWWSRPDGPMQIPELSAEAQAGTCAFDLYRARRHGVRVGARDQGGMN